MAHALVGYVSGELAGSKSSFSNALAAGVNKFVTEEILKDEKTRLHYKEHPEELQWISAALGAAIGQMAGGDATSGASIAASGTKNNRLNEEDFEQYKKELADAKNTAERKAILEKYKDIDIGHEKELQVALEDEGFRNRLEKALSDNPDLETFEGKVLRGNSIVGADYWGTYLMPDETGKMQIWNEANIGVQAKIAGLAVADKSVQVGLITSPNKMTHDYEAIGGGGNVYKLFGVEAKGIVDRKSNVYGYAGGTLSGGFPVNFGKTEGDVSGQNGRTLAESISGWSGGFGYNDAISSQSVGFGFGGVSTIETGTGLFPSVAGNVGYTQYVGNLIQYQIIKRIKESGKK